MADIKDIKLGNTKYNIKIPSSRVKSMADYTKPSSKPSPEAIQQSDTLNAALGKLEYKADTNQTNILLVESMNGGKNLLEFGTIGIGTTISDSFVTGGVRFTRNVDDSITVTRESSNANNAYCVFILNSAYVTIDSLCDNDHYLIGCPTGGGSSSFELLAGTINARDYGSGVLLPTLSSGQSGIIPQIVVRPAFTGTVTFKPMIISKAAFNAGFTDYQPYALPNSDLTRLESEDRASLAEEIDAGAKNIISGGWYNSSGDPNLTFTANSDGSLTISKSAATSAAVFITAKNISMTSAQYVCSLVTTNSNIVLQLRDSSGNTTYGSSTSNTPFTIPNTSNTYKPMIRIDASATFSNVTVKPMICTKAAFGVSSKFVPYRPNWDLVCDSVPTLKRIAYWASTFTIPIKPFAESTGGYMYKIYVNGGNPGELGVYLITGSLVTDIKAHSKVSYTINEGTSVVFNATSTVVAYYELIKFPST